MGMAASQARLLCITARIHDVEFQAQTIQNAKMALARLSNEASQEYLDVLDGNVMTVSSTEANTVATYNNLMSVNRLQGASGQNYAFTYYGSMGPELIVPADVCAGLDKFNDTSLSKNAQAFAIYMICGKDINETNNLLNNSGELTKYINSHKQNYDYYYQMYQMVQESEGEYISIDDSEFQGALNGDAGNDSDWLLRMVQSGQIVINTVVNNKKTGVYSLAATSLSSDSSLGTTPKTEIDKKQLAIAEAKYEKTLKDINNKDKQYDMQLSKLETERSALTTQYDSLKKVIEDNVERTFGIFS